MMSVDVNYKNISDEIVNDVTYKLGVDLLVRNFQKDVFLFNRRTEGEVITSSLASEINNQLVSLSTTIGRLLGDRIALMKPEVRGLQIFLDDWFTSLDEVSKSRISSSVMLLREQIDLYLNAPDHPKSKEQILNDLKFIDPQTSARSNHPSYDKFHGHDPVNIAIARYLGKNPDDLSSSDYDFLWGKLLNMGVDEKEDPLIIEKEAIKILIGEENKISYKEADNEKEMLAEDNLLGLAAESMIRGKRYELDQ